MMTPTGHQCHYVSTVRPDIIRNHGGRWKAAINKYMVVMPSTGKVPCMAEQVMSAPPLAKVKIVMKAKVGAAARHSHRAMLVAVPVVFPSDGPGRVRLA